MIVGLGEHELESAPTFGEGDKVRVVIEGGADVSDGAVLVDP